MSQEPALQEALTKLIDGYKNKIEGFNYEEFMKTGVDPFRFTVNVSIWGLENAVKKEIEHKVEMTLENLVGDFHEDYLGSTTHLPTGTQWKKIPEGSIPGIDIANDELQAHYQIKSKHNSMNSSSAKKLAEELIETSKQYPESDVGCLWVVAKQERRAIGENVIAEESSCYKGKQSYKAVTGVSDELDSTLATMLESAPKVLSSIEFKTLDDAKAQNIHDAFKAILENATNRVIKDLKDRANEEGITEIQLVTKQSIN